MVSVVETSGGTKEEIRRRCYDHDIDHDDDNDEDDEIKSDEENKEKKESKLA